MDQDVKFSSSSPAVEISSDRWPTPLSRSLGRLASLEWSVVASLSLLVMLGLGLRLNQLGAIGFAEDEMNKLDAVRAYQWGDFSANAEHPMVMKLLMYGSVAGSDVLRATGLAAISDEAAVRFPNALFGALTAIPLFLLTAAFFDRRTGLLAAAFWAGGINAITLNRIGKEDTLLVFFILSAFYFYLRAKLTSPRNALVRSKNYALSAGSFGLMIASKYFPHYLGLNMLFHHHWYVGRARPGDPTGKTPQWFYILIVVVFIVANPAMLLPPVWHYLNAYMSERLLVHSGYLFAGHLYKNNMSSTPFWGTPIYFYALFLAIKMPLLVVFAFLVGLVVSFRRWREPAYAFPIFMFLFWIVPYSLMGAKWLRYTLALLPFVYMLAAVGVTALLRLAGRTMKKSMSLTAAISAAVVLVFVGLPGWIALANGPHYALYTNHLAADKSGYFFPHDEFYDDGLREAIQFVCTSAPQAGVIAHETPAVAQYYLTRFGRPDLKSHTMSEPTFDPASLDESAYIIVQQGRTYFENQAKLAFIRSHFRKVYEVEINGLTAAEVFTNNLEFRN